MRRSVIRLYIIILILFCNSITKDVNAADLKQLYDFSLKIQKSFEGYHSKISGEDISYPSLRNDISDAILTRCTTGNSFIEWNTAPVPDNYKEHSVSFSWIASFDNTNKNRPFDVYINDVKRFTFEYTGNPNWSVNLSNNATLSFFKVKGDQHNDAQGYTLLSIPTSWIKPGLPVKIKICGQALGSNAWYMVFKCTNTVSYLQESMKYQGWFNLTSEKETNELSLSIHAPYYFSNKVLNLESGTIKKDIAFKLQGEDAIGMTTLPTSSIDQPFALNDKNNRLFNLKSLSGTYNESTLQEKSVVIRQCIEKGTSFNALINIVYQPGLSNSLLELSRGKFSEGSIMLMNSSHQDIAWMDSPEKCIIERDTMLLAPLFDQAKLNPNYRFDVEDVLMVKEFISRHPERKAEFQDLLLSGKLSCGSSYQMPYEEMYSDEALVRQFYLGAKWLKKEFNGYQANTYWNVDVPGRSLQMPQILKKAGTDFMVISRQTPGIFNWFSPDGSFVTTYSMGHYSLEYPNLNKPFFEAADFIGHSILEWDKRINLKADSKPVAPLFSDWDMSPAKDYSALISGWNSISSFEKKDGTIVNLNLPKISLSTAPAFLKKYVDANASLPSIKGERPAVWLYIHGPSHQKAIRTSRDGDILMTIAEKFSTIDCLLKKSFSGYPETRLTKAWENKIFPDHGWGGKHGDITDALFEAKYTSALSEAKQLTEISLNNIASTILTNNKKGIPVIVFNSLSWERTDPVSITVNFDPSKAASLKLYNGEG
ncbi:MAG: hypothetical protein Q8862_12725, partial [Bacteroidota bacterium]|nr:hypothetical protein [Bacteroidota bacterium]